MTENNISNSQLDLNTISKRNAIQKKVKWFTIRTIAIVFWSYIVSKLFIFDLDVLLINRFFPDAIWVIQYRWVLTLAILAIIALVFWNRKQIGPILYIIFFPFILIFFHVPLWLIRRRAWTLSVAILATTLSVIRSLRATIILSSLFIFGTLFITISSTSWLLLLGMCFLTIFIASIYFRIIRDAFRSPFDIFSAQSLDKLWSALNTGYSRQVDNFDVQTMTETQKNSWISYLQINVSYNRICYFLAEKLISLRQVRILAAISGVKIAWLFATTLIVFTVINLGLYKFDPTQFEVSGTVRGFDFLWYTFQATFINNISEIIPIGIVSRSIFIVNGVTIGFILFVIVMFFITSVQTERNSEQIEILVDSIQQQAKAVETFILDVFGLTLSAAIEELVQVNAIMADWIVKNSPDIEPVSKKLEEDSRDKESLENGED